MLGAIVSAISTFLGLVFSMSQILESWFIGSFSQLQRGRYEYLWLILIVTILVFQLANYFTIIGLGQKIATNLGLDYQRYILIGMALISVTTGIITTVIGNLPFLGLIVPNLVSMFNGDDLQSNLSWVCLLGTGLILLCDILSRIIIAPLEMPVSLILSILGSIIFIPILLFQRRAGR